MKEQDLRNVEPETLHFGSVLGIFDASTELKTLAQLDALPTDDDLLGLLAQAKNLSVISEGPIYVFLRRRVRGQKQHMIIASYEQGSLESYTRPPWRKGTECPFQPLPLGCLYLD